MKFDTGRIVAEERKKRESANDRERYDRLLIENERLKARLKQMGDFLCRCKWTAAGPDFERQRAVQCAACTMQAQWAAEDAKR